MSNARPCDSCHRLIKFIKTPAGKHMPVEARYAFMVPTPSGPHNAIAINCQEMLRGVLFKEGKESEAIAQLRAMSKPDGPSLKIVRVWVPHWGNCNDPKRFKREESVARISRPPVANGAPRTCAPSPAR